MVAQKTETKGGDILGAKLASALLRLQQMHNDMTVLQVRTFFLVAAYPGSTQKAIFKALDSNDSAVSRAMAVLSHAPEKPGRKKGLGLVEYRENPNDRREKFMTLSPRGKREWADIMRDLA